MLVHELTEATEIEFVCVNASFCDATDQKSQDALYQALKSVPGIIVYRQDFSEHNSMAAILKQGATKQTARQIATLAKKHNVGIDLENDVSNSFIDEIYNGTADGLIDFYDTDNLTEARLQPDRDYLAHVGELLNDANADYAEFLKNNNDKDDMDELVDILQSHSNADELDLNWHVGKPNKKAVDWYIQSAIVHGDGSIDVILDPDSTIGHWGPKSFKDSVLKTLAHETIHLAQRDRMGADKYAKLPSGYMQGVRKAEKSGNERDMIRTYFRDPHELMAHGHDLAQEILASSNPEDALRNPEKYREELPAYDKHRQIFPPNAKPLQQLLKYASGYVNER